MQTRYVKSLPRNWDEYSRVYNALGDAQRQKILLLFEPGERLTVEQIVDAFPLSRTAVVHHLRVLLEAGVLIKERVGKEAHLRIDKSYVVTTVRKVCDFMERHA